jgi:hypothetical protein
MYCDRCGANLYTEDRFCYRCGKEVPEPLPGGSGLKPQQTISDESVPGIAAEHSDGSELTSSKREPFQRQDGPVAPPQLPAAMSDAATAITEMRKDIAGWGVGLLIMGVLSIVLSQYLDPVWGVIIIILGILNLAIRQRGMYIANGIALIFIGIVNALGAIMTYSNTFVAVYGGAQVYWGIKELVKYGKYGKRIKLNDEVRSEQCKTHRKKNPWMIAVGIVLVYIIIGLSIVLMETVDGDFWYIYTDYFGSKHSIGQSNGTDLPVYIRAIETAFYPVLYVFRSLFRLC